MSLFSVGLLIASLTMLFAEIIRVHLDGQGLSGHTAQTAMARYYMAERGKVLSILSLDYPIGESVFLTSPGLRKFIPWTTKCVKCA